MLGHRGTGARLLRLFVPFLFALTLAQAQRLGVIGDWGADTRGRAQVAALLRKEHAQSPLTALLTAGDNFYPRGRVVEAYLQDLPPSPSTPPSATTTPRTRGPAPPLRPGEAPLPGPLRRPEVFVLYTEGDLRAQRAWLEKALQSSTAPSRPSSSTAPSTPRGSTGEAPP